MTTFDLVRDLVAAHPGTVALGVVLTYLLWRLFRGPRNLPPGPRPWPLIGNLTYFRDLTLQYLDYERLGREFGPVASLYFGRRLHVVLNTHAVIKEAWLSRGLDFQDRNPALLGNDYVDFIDEVFNCPYTKDWEWKKKFALRAFKNAGSGTRASQDQILAEVSELVTWLERQGNKPFDIEEALVQVHANMSLQTLVGKKYPWFSKNLQQMVDAGREFYEVIETACATDLYLAPQYLPLWVVRLLFREKLRKYIDKGCDNALQIAREAMEEKRREGMNPNPEQQDFLEAYLTQREDLKGQDRLILNTICIFMPDAIDSASSLGLFTLLHLCHNPQFQTKCQEQIDDVCGTRQPNLDDRSQLHWVEACLWEATRLGVTLPISLAHTVTKETTLRGFTVPRDNACVIANLYAGNRDPEVFPDPECFDPARFLDDDGVFHRSEDVLSYSIGKRSCPGKATVELQLYLIFSSLLQRFSFRFEPGEPEPEPCAMPGNMFRRPHPFKVVADPR